MNISVIGTGYVGLVTGACLAGSGNNVICVDIDQEKINGLKEGHVTFYEPGLEDIVRKNIKEERLHFTTDLDYAVKNSSVVLIAVGTPPNEDGSADTSAVINVASSIGKSLDDYKVIVTKSTVPVGTTEMIRDEINKVTDIKFDVASNPEFLKEGAAVEDFMKPDRVLIGVDNESAAQILKELYTPFMRSMDRAVVVSIRSSELAKYTANAMLATRISFMNEIANLCEVVGANISEVRVAIGSDDRIGRHFLFPGIGYGGSCFPKDVKALINIGSEYGSELHICRATDEVNTKQRELFWKKIENYFEGQLESKKISIWGISFKPKTDDIREAPSLFIIEKLLSAGASVTVHDPVAIENTKAHFGDKVNYAVSNYAACEGTDALVINTEWNEYRQPDFQKLKELMNGNVIFDGRNLYNPDTLKKIGIKYVGVGIGN
ncbi:MAG: UDP-glucose/GDP-mannose dehydrogenase family protein [Thermodesulfobacteriales bacterium]|nr:MAG: UDP-glucose/GDP-mannose dehydrogenase family protein [Thermodesulfobacteriales bacterium]